MKLYNKILLISCLMTTSCKYVPDQLFYKHAEILDIKRDDESQYHLLVRYQDGTTESIANASVIIKMGSYKPTAKMPFVKWNQGDKKGILKAWYINSSQYSGMDILVYLPLDYKIVLWKD